MRKYLLLVLVLICLQTRSQNLIQGTIKKGATADEFEIWLKPNFINSTQYLFQIGMPIAFPASASPQPTGITVSLDPTFTSSFGNNYTVTVNPVATATGGTEKYFNIVLVRGGAGASSAQNWNPGVEFKVLTGTFTYSSGNTTFLAKLADYQDGGSDGQGNFYTQDGVGNYYVTSNSIGNFYASAGNSVVGGTASAGFAQLTSASLPVSLTNFDGQRQGNKIILTWTTVSETNNKGFEVHSSTDGIHFQSIAFIHSVAPGGNANSALTYRYEDLSASNETKYYRLEQIDWDGQTKWSPVLPIYGEKQVGLLLYPNPASHFLNLNVRLTKKQNLQLKIFDAGGRLVMNSSRSANEGTNQISCNITYLLKGVYQLQIETGSGVLATSFVKQ
jgi:hypothetical protein